MRLDSTGLLLSQSSQEAEIKAFKIESLLGLQNDFKAIMDIFTAVLLQDFLKELRNIKVFIIPSNSIHEFKSTHFFVVSGNNGSFQNLTINIK